MATSYLTCESRSETMGTNLTYEQIERMERMNPSLSNLTGLREQGKEVKDEGSPNTAKERVEQELDELNEKIGKLTCFLYGRKIVEGVVTPEMRELMKQQLSHMLAYAETLQDRLMIWDFHKN